MPFAYARGVAGPFHPMSSGPACADRMPSGPRTSEASGGPGPPVGREEVSRSCGLDDPTLLAFALNGAFMQSCTRAGLAARRDEIGARLVDVAERHGLENFEVLGHLIRMQARGGLGDFPAADAHAAAADRLAERPERPPGRGFTRWDAAPPPAPAGGGGPAGA